MNWFALKDRFVYCAGDRLGHRVRGSILYSLSLAYVLPLLFMDFCPAVIIRNGDGGATLFLVSVKQHLKTAHEPYVESL